MAREQKLAAAFIELADTLVSDYDVTDLLHGLAERCVDLLGAAAAGILLTDQRGSLQLLASSTEAARLLELFQLQTNEGPCLDAFRSGTPVIVRNLPDAAGRWPAFVPAATDAGYAGVNALPLRLRTDTIGAMNLFTTSESGVLTEEDVEAAQALADVATIGILQERAMTRHELLIEQLQGALTSRIIIEQAKGVLAAQAGVTPDEAFVRLRRHARSTQTRLTEAARDLVDGRLDPAAVGADTGGA
jgi:GAF domain-containing protein